MALVIFCWTLPLNKASFVIEAAWCLFCSLTKIKKKTTFLWWRRSPNYRRFLCASQPSHPLSTLRSRRNATATAHFTITIVFRCFRAKTNFPWRMFREYISLHHGAVDGAGQQNGAPAIGAPAIGALQKRIPTKRHTGEDRVQLRG